MSDSAYFSSELISTDRFVTFDTPTFGVQLVVRESLILSFLDQLQDTKLPEARTCTITWGSAELQTSQLILGTAAECAARVEQR